MADIITPTIRKRGSQIIWTVNRLLELDPIYEHIIINQMPNVLHIQANYDVAEKYGWPPDEIQAKIEFEKKHDPASTPTSGSVSHSARWTTPSSAVTPRYRSYSAGWTTQEPSRSAPTWRLS